MHTCMQSYNHDIEKLYCRIKLNQKNIRRFIMNYLEIEKVVGRENLVSRGIPTVEAEVYLVD